MNNLYLNCIETRLKMKVEKANLYKEGTKQTHHF